MSTPDQSPKKVSDRLHPAAQLAAAGLLIWFVVEAWLRPPVVGASRSAKLGRIDGGGPARGLGHAKV
jgi:hypothetical protein